MFWNSERNLSGRTRTKSCVIRKAITLTERGAAAHAGVRPASKSRKARKHETRMPMLCVKKKLQPRFHRGFQLFITLPQLVVEYIALALCGGVEAREGKPQHQCVSHSYIYIYICMSSYRVFAIASGSPATVPGNRARSLWCPCVT